MLGVEELRNLALFDLAVEHSVTRDAQKVYIEVINSMKMGSRKQKAWDSRTTQKLVDELTNIKPILYDCCVNSCMCFVGKYATLQVPITLISSSH